MKRKLVFVDPDDSSQKYWWPAMLIHSSEYSVLKKQKITIPSRSEVLVCYFEDGSFSTVDEKDTIEFDVNTKEFIEYSKNEEFLNDKGVRAAVAYLTNGTIPKHFDWLLLDEIPTKEVLKTKKQRWMQMYKNESLIN